MKNKFPVLDFVAGVLILVGWLAAGVGLLWLLRTLLGLIGSENEYMIGLTLLESLPPFLLFVSGLGVVAFGESIGVLFAIEANTRQAAEAARAAVPRPTYSTSPAPEPVQGPVSNKRATVKAAAGDGSPLFKD